MMLTADLNKLVDRLAGACEKAAATPSHFRSKVLAAVSEGLRKDREVFAQLICEE
ncbi:MAG: hypothetical protein HY400_05610, partial [Elusimicrobia bacterium]|nr:hypothetical protein [Elusimicrobiota bacterium]